MSTFYEGQIKFRAWFVVITLSGCSWVGMFWNGIWQKSRPRAREVQKNRWQEMEMFKGGISRLKVLWKTHAQRQKPFKKACGSFFSNKHRHKHLPNNPIFLYPKPFLDQPQHDTTLFLPFLSFALFYAYWVPTLFPILPKLFSQSLLLLPINLL